MEEAAAVQGEAEEPVPPVRTAASLHTIRRTVPDLLPRDGATRLASWHSEGELVMRPTQLLEAVVSCR